MAENIGEIKGEISTIAEEFLDLASQANALHERIGEVANTLVAKLEGSGHDEAARAVGMVAAGSDALTLTGAALTEATNAAQSYVGAI